MAEKSAPKNIILCCDGTGNEFSSSNSNVLKLYTALDLDDPARQVAYYHPGVGTMGAPTARNRVERVWTRLMGLAFGAGFVDNVLDAYRFLMRVYEPGDHIYLFGFSRGAYTARAVAGLLHGYGLLHRGNEGHLPYAWRLFVQDVKMQRKQLKRAQKQRTTHNAHTIAVNTAFAETFSRPVPIRFIGLWDTVSSIGWIYEPLRLLSLAQNPIIQTIRHAVSIDEKRAFFRDNLYGDPTAGQDLAQVWFPGVHSDVGGSYPRDQSDPANTALHWMLGEIASNGVFLCLDRVALVLGAPLPHSALNPYYTPPALPFHELHNSLNWHWWLGQFLPQQHYDKDDEQINWRVPFWTPRELPAKAIVHASAVQRLDGLATAEPPYKPRNLVRRWLHPLHPGQVPTGADLTGCFIYRPEDRHPPTTLETLWRRAIVFVMAVIDIVLVLTLLSLLILGLCWAKRGLAWLLVHLCHGCALYWTLLHRWLVHLVHHTLR